MTNVMFLPGIIAPAAVRYAPLLQHLHGVNAVLKDLEVYTGEEPPPDYSVATEVEGIDRAADAAGWDRFHIYAHSGGGACALAYLATRPDRILSLAVDEPATDFTDADRADPDWDRIEAAQRLTGRQAVQAFLALQVAEGVTLPPPPQGPPPPWMAKRPAGINAFAAALRRHRIPIERYTSFPGPVLYTYGSLSSRRWATMRDRLAGLFHDFRSERFDGLHHLNTSHQAEPARTADLLRELWGDR